MNCRNIGVDRIQLTIAHTDSPVKYNYWLYRQNIYEAVHKGRNRCEEVNTDYRLFRSCDLSGSYSITMWPNPGPPLPIGGMNPAFPPGYNPAYHTSTAYPAFPANPAYPPNIHFPGHSAHSPGLYPQPPNPAYPPHQYPAAMNPAMLPNGPPGVMPYGAPQPHLYPPGPHGCPRIPPPGVYPHGYPRSPKWGHHKGYYHGGANTVSGAVAGGLTTMVMGAVTHKVNKKMRKKMKKAHKWHKHGYYCKSSSSSSSDSD